MNIKNVLLIRNRVFCKEQRKLWKKQHLFKNVKVDYLEIWKDENVLKLARKASTLHNTAHLNITQPF
jgi:hypothetical protein